MLIRTNFKSVNYTIHDTTIVIDYTSKGLSMDTECCNDLLENKDYLKTLNRLTEQEVIDALKTLEANHTAYTLGIFLKG